MHEVHTDTEGEAEGHDGFFALGQAQRHFCPVLHRRQRPLWMQILPVGAGLGPALDSELGAAVQAAQARGARGLVPCGHAIAHLDGANGTALCAQATAHASVRIDSKFARILAYGQAKAVVEPGGKCRDGVAHVIARRAIGNHLRAFIDLLVCAGVNRRNLLLIGKIEHRRPSVGHLDAVLSGSLNALFTQQVGSKPRGLPGSGAKGRCSEDIRIGRNIECRALKKINGRRGQAPAIRGSDKSQVATFLNSDARMAIALIPLDGHRGVVHALGNALGNVFAVALCAEVQNHAGPNPLLLLIRHYPLRNAGCINGEPALPASVY